MFEKSPYPLFTLKLLGTICPCLEKDEDSSARKAAWSISSSTIRWHRRLRCGGSANADVRGSSGGSAKMGVSSFISGIFGVSPSSSSPTAALTGDVHYDPLDGASLSLQDSPHGPMLVVSPPFAIHDIDSVSIRNKKIPLKIMKTVQARNGMLNSLVGSRSTVEILDRDGRELIRFDLLKSTSIVQSANTEEDGNMPWEDADETSRDELIDQLEILIQWEKRRQDYLVTLGDDDQTTDEENEYDVSEYDDDEDGGAKSSSPSKKGAGGAIAERARKIQHFAQREIEMQKTKRERENRKAKYVKEAGGLKYTAIAMANRS